MADELLPPGRDSVLVAVVTIVNGHPLIVLVREPEHRAPIYDKPPGGEVEVGESPLQACIREVKEETDIDVMACELSLQGDPPPPVLGRTGWYTQYLYLALVPPDRIIRHMGKDVVTCVDPDGKRLESTCYDLGGITRLRTLMPKHRDMLLALVPK